MIIIGLDPGTEQSALVAFAGDAVPFALIEPNLQVLEWMRQASKDSVLVVEEFESFGMSVGRSVFRTVRWSGRFEQAWHPGRVEFIPRRLVKQHLCHTARATDANIRTELIDRWGGQQQAIGAKQAPGPLYYIKSHCWAALALAVTWYDLHAHEGDLIRPGVTAAF